MGNFHWKLFLEKLEEGPNVAGLNRNLPDANVSNANNKLGNANFFPKKGFVLTN